MESQQDSGGAKKFLYTGPKKGGEEEEDVPWNFNTKSQKQSPHHVGSKFEMDSVWSIQRNVNVGGATGIRSPKSDNLNFNTNKGYYSRHGGTSKDKDEFGTGNTEMGATDTSGGKTWSVGNQSRRPFSYSFGTEAPILDPPVSPRNVSNSSASVYPQTNSFSGAVNSNGSQSSRVTNQGNGQNSLKGGNFMNFNSSGIGVSHSTTVTNNKVMSSTANVGVGQSYNSMSRNSLFSTSQPKGGITQNDLLSPKDWSANSKSTFGGGSPRRPNKSFW